MPSYMPDFIRRVGRATSERYFSNLATGMENFGSDARYVVLPVALGMFLKSFYNDAVPDGMVTESLANPAYAFGAGEAVRSVGYVLREARDKALTIPKAAGAVVRAAAPFWLVFNVANGSEGARGAMADTFPPMIVWGLGHATDTKA